jgi:hypothetical protein
VRTEHVTTKADQHFDTLVVTPNPESYAGLNAAKPMQVSHFRTEYDGGQASRKVRALFLAGSQNAELTYLWPRPDCLPVGIHAKDFNARARSEHRGALTGNASITAGSRNANEHDAAAGSGSAHEHNAAEHQTFAHTTILRHAAKQGLGCNRAPAPAAFFAA